MFLGLVRADIRWWRWVFRKLSSLRLTASRGCIEDLLLQYGWTTATIVLGGIGTAIVQVVGFPAMARRFGLVKSYRKVVALYLVSAVLTFCLVSISVHLNNSEDGYTNPVVLLGCILFIVAIVLVRAAASMCLVSLLCLVQTVDPTRSKLGLVNGQSMFDDDHW